MKRILHMTPADIKSGVYRYVFNNMEYLNNGKYQFGFLTRAANQLRETEEFKKMDFQIHAFSSTQRENPAGLIKEVKAVLSMYDIIHLHTSSWRGFMIEEQAMEMGLQKVIVHAHSTGIDIVDSEERKKQIQEHLAYRMRFSEKYATDFCACSHNAAQWLFGNSISAEKICYMPNAVDTVKFQYDLKKREKMRKLLGVDSKFVIGHVGRFSFTKNHVFLFRCLSEVIKIAPQVILICIGQGELQSYLEQMIIQMNLKKHVILLGWKNNIEDYLQAFDLFCLPSEFEGFPISLVEAQASGLNCLISDCVTREVALTDLTEYLPIQQEIWINRICSYIDMKNNHRAGYKEEICRKGYDIKQSARMLENLYDK